MCNHYYACAQYITILNRACLVSHHHVPSPTLLISPYVSSVPLPSFTLSPLSPSPPSSHLLLPPYFPPHSTLPLQVRTCYLVGRSVSWLCGSWPRARATTDPDSEPRSRELHVLLQTRALPSHFRTTVSMYVCAFLQCSPQKLWKT